MNYNDDILFLKAEYRKAYFVAKKLFRNNNQPLSCSIHEIFESGDNHNCIGCNLAKSEVHFVNFLKRNRSFTEKNETYIQFILFSYLIVERIYEIFKIIQMNESYKNEHFKTFTLIKRWANFYKHPKSFMFVHHPYYTFENHPDFNEQKKNMIIVDSNFILKYYNGDSKNTELYNLLTNKKDVLVIFPNIEELTKLFCLEIIHFVDLLRNNSVYRYILSQKSTYENYYSTDSTLESDITE
jgi:hypothetical protein